MTTRRNPGWARSGPVEQFLPAPVDEPDPDPDREPLEDITIEDIRRAVNFACARSRTSLSPQEKFDIGWGGAVLEWLENDEATFWDICQAAQNAISKDLHDTLRHRGALPESKRATNERFHLFWDQKLVHHDSYGLERMAVHQMWEDLEDHHRDVLLHSTVFRTRAEAAREWGIGQQKWGRMLRDARQAALDLWFDWEPAPAPIPHPPPHKTHCVRGHDMSQHAKYVFDKRRGALSRRCGACMAIRNKTYRESAAEKKRQAKETE